MSAPADDAEEPLPTTCDGCAFWDAYDDIGPGSRGRCRVNPPTIDVDGGGVWPETCGEDWCGSFLSRDEAP